MKTCNNCSSSHSCYYKGIYNPCKNWNADASIISLRAKAAKCLKHQLSFEEGRFVQSCVYAESFSVKQESWLISIYSRVKALELV
jgi:hypothetical protein